MNIPQFLRPALQFVQSNSPSILTIVGVTGVLATTISAVSATFAAAEDLRDATEQIEVDTEGTPYTIVKDLAPKEKIGLVWKHYIPTASIMIATGACIIGANSVSSRRTAALASAYSLTEKAFSEYKEKVLETVGQKKEQQVRDEIVKDQVAANPPSSQLVINDTTDVTCYETLTGRYFSSNVQKIESAANKINQRVLQDMYASANDFWDLLGLEYTQIGEDLGFNIDCMLEVVFTSTLDQNTKPVLAVGYRVVPIANYHKVF